MRIIPCMLMNKTGVVIMNKDLIFAVEHTPYYLDYLKKTTSINDLPIITKELVSCNYNSFITNTLQSKELISVMTSGSTGMPLKILWAPLDYCNSLAELWKERKKYGVYPNDKFVSCHAMYYNNQIEIHNKAIIYKNNLSLSKLSLNKSVYSYYFHLIESFRPRFMMLPPSFVYGLISFLKDEELKLPDSITLIELTGEKCSEELYEWFVDNYPNYQWNIMYGMQEFNGIAYGSIDGLTVCEKNVIVKIINKDGELAKDCEEGNIIVTGLKNSVFPLINYKTEDRGYFDSTGKLHITRSRSNDSFICNGNEFDGAVFWTVIFHLMQHYKINILQFQVKALRDHLNFFLVLKDKTSYSVDCLSNIISDFLMSRFKIQTCVSVLIVDSISAECGKNKTKFFINEDSIEGGKI